VALRAIAVWLVLLVIAIANGAAREGLISPRVGQAAGHVISTILLCLLIIALTWLTLPWIGPSGTSDALAIGLWWVALTLAFEFLAGHFLFGKPWPELLADYNLLRGRIWPLVPLVTLLAPSIVFRISGAR
jgi:hypothetical protein